VAKNDGIGAHARGEKGVRLLRQGENEREKLPWMSEKIR
jgi:hypothetical protein